MFVPPHSLKLGEIVGVTYRGYRGPPVTEEWQWVRFGSGRTNIRPLAYSLHVDFLTRIHTLWVDFRTRACTHRV
jgi:hypothetical protein